MSNCVGVVMEKNLPENFDSLASHLPRLLNVTATDTDDISYL